MGVGAPRAPLAARRALWGPHPRRDLRSRRDDFGDRRLNSASLGQRTGRTAVASGCSAGAPPSRAPRITAWWLLTAGVVVVPAFVALAVNPGTPAHQGGNARRQSGAAFKADLKSSGPFSSCARSGRTVGRRGRSFPQAAGAQPSVGVSAVTSGTRQYLDVLRSRLICPWLPSRLRRAHGQHGAQSRHPAIDHSGWRARRA